jgi:transcriptional regulator with XRE-family HTH domain
MTSHRFKQIRIKRNLSIVRLGILLGLSRQTISKYENDKIHIDKRTRLAMLAIEKGLL